MANNYEGGPRGFGQSDEESASDAIAGEREYTADMEGEKNFEEKLSDAQKTLENFRSEFNASTSMIPLDEYDHYLEAAQTYKGAEENHPGDVDKKLIIMANSIIEEAPAEAAA
jgi:hypothetical protein